MASDGFCYRKYGENMADLAVSYWQVMLIMKFSGSIKVQAKPCGTGHSRCKCGD
jgi:hypothetical protein